MEFMQFSVVRVSIMHTTVRLICSGFGSIRRDSDEPVLLLSYHFLHDKVVNMLKVA